MVIKKVLILIISLLTNLISVNAQKEYNNNLYHFSFNYPIGLSKLPDYRINEINNLQHNKQLGIDFEAGFENIYCDKTPLILVYIIKNQHPSAFNKTVEKYANSDIDISNIVNSLNKIKPLIKSTNVDKPLVDLENKIMIFNGEIDLEIWPYPSKGKMMFVQFYGKEKIVQINFASTVQDFDHDLNKFFWPIISSFEFSIGYDYSEAKNTSQINNSTTNLNPAEEFLSGYTNKFICNGSGKGSGLKFSIKYPQSWKSEEGNRPHIVRKLSNSEFSASAILLVIELEYDPSKSEIDENFNEKMAKEMIPVGGYYLKSSKAVIDGERAMFLDYFSESEKLGTLVKSRVRIYTIIYKNYLLQVQFSVEQNPIGKPNDLSELFKQYEVLFNLMMNSLVIVSKWENN